MVGARPVVVLVADAVSGGKLHIGEGAVGSVVMVVDGLFGLVELGARVLPKLCGSDAGRLERSDTALVLIPWSAIEWMLRGPLDDASDLVPVDWVESAGGAKLVVMVLMMWEFATLVACCC